MGAPTIRLLSAAALLAIGAAVGPAVSAVAAPATTTQTVAVSRATTGGDADIAALTSAEAVLDATAQRTADGGEMRLVDTRIAPPAWLLLLLVPILLGGTVGVGATLRRLR